MNLSSRDSALETIAAILLEREQVVVTAESCTGGGIARALTSVAGSSHWFCEGFITYSNNAKVRRLAVPRSLLERFGAVSEEVVLAMAEGALGASASADYAVAVSGIAGPGGGSEDKPVGTVWLAWGARGGHFVSRCFHFQGDRESVRQQSEDAAIIGLHEYLERSR